MYRLVIFQINKNFFGYFKIRNETTNKNGHTIDPKNPIEKKLQVPWPEMSKAIKKRINRAFPATVALANGMRLLSIINEKEDNIATVTKRPMAPKSK